MRVAWVIGRRGLLGAALARSLARSGTSAFEPDDGLPWHDEAMLPVTMKAIARRFAHHVGPDDDWEVHWAAGIGSMNSPAAVFVPEVVALEALLSVLAATPLDRSRGCLTFASSAGAIYAGASRGLVTERVAEAPTTAYAEAKLALERAVRTFTDDTGIRHLIFRLSTLYGAAQSKRRGLITHIAQCLVLNRPVQIFVPLDTIRDYIAVDDAAELMIDTVRIARGSMMKIVASQQPATVGEIVAIFKRIARRPLRVVTSATPATGIYTSCIQFRSLVEPLARRQPTSLVVGIGDVLRAELLRMASSIDHAKR